MNEQTKLILAAALELGFPIALGIAALLWPAIRSRVAVILGALTPLLLAYVVITVGHLMGQTAASIAFEGIWIITLFHYVACAALGIALAILPVPRTASARYIVGLLPPSVVAVAWAIGTRL